MTLINYTNGIIAVQDPISCKVINLEIETGQPAAYLDIGTGTPVLFLHGFLGEKSCWLPLMQRMAHRYRCVSLDLLGFGESGKPMIRYDVATEVAFVRQFIQTLQLDCYIVGHSFGAWVAAAYALQYEVKGLILAGPAGIRDDSFCGRYDHLRPLLWETPVIDWVLDLAKPVAKITGKEADLAQIRWFRQEIQANPAARSFIIDRIRPEDAIDTIEKEIHQLRVPTLIIAGDRDETIPLWHSETYAREIPNAKLEIIPNATHALPQLHAEEMAELILPFLK